MCIGYAIGENGVRYKNSVLLHFGKHEWEAEGSASTGYEIWHM